LHAVGFPDALILASRQDIFGHIESKKLWRENDEVMMIGHWADIITFLDGLRWYKHINGEK